MRMTARVQEQRVQDRHPAVPIRNGAIHRYKRIPEGLISRGTTHPTGQTSTKSIATARVELYSLLSQSRLRSLWR
eukprot:3002812-Prymnesium_polylepis.1